MTNATTTERWYCFEIYRNGQWLYIGKCETTAQEIRATFPYAEIQGNLVKVYGMVS